MMLIEPQVELDGLDEYDRERASDMDERPLYPVPILLIVVPAPVDEETNPDEKEV